VEKEGHTSSKNAEPRRKVSLHWRRRIARHCSLGRAAAILQGRRCQHHEP
jgi:hypothetical protein